MKLSIVFSNAMVESNFVDFFPVHQMGSFGLLVFNLEKVSDMPVLQIFDHELVADITSPITVLQDVYGKCQ